MVVIVLQILGWAAFIIGTLLTGRQPRQHRDKAIARQTSRVMHGLFFAGLVIPGGLGILHPGLTRGRRCCDRHNRPRLKVISSPQA